jgi:hypothetical protein
MKNFTLPFPYAISIFKRVGSCETDGRKCSLRFKYHPRSVSSNKTLSVCAWAYVYNHDNINFCGLCLAAGT